jgi:thymidylate kinase
MKMKIVSTAFFVGTAALFELYPRAGVLAPAAVVLFTAYGLWRSAASKLDILNDVPNAFRVLLATMGGFLIAQDGLFVLPSAGLLLYGVSILLNDEYQRRTLHSVRRRARGGSIALLGIDGAGKSSHARVLGEWLAARGYYVTVMPFHRYLFVERLASMSMGASRRTTTASTGGRRSGRNPLRPLLSLVDNLILQIATSVGSRIEGRIVIYDRFIWSTYVKYEALGYPVKPLSFIYLLPRPLSAGVRDIPVERSLSVIDERGASHIHYPREVLQKERDRYLSIARAHDYPVIDSSAAFDEVQGSIESHFSGVFPLTTGAGRR